MINKMMKRKLKAMVARPHKKPCVIEIDGTPESICKIVGGAYDISSEMFGYSPLLHFSKNDSFHGQPNRVIYASPSILGDKLVTRLDPRGAIEVPHIYKIFYGPVLGIAYEQDKKAGELKMRDMTFDECLDFEKLFGHPVSYFEYARLIDFNLRNSKNICS